MSINAFSELKEDEHIDLNQREHLRFDVLSVYPRQIRKRTQSESEKVRLEDSSRYKTGSVSRITCTLIDRRECPVFQKEIGFNTRFIKANDMLNFNQDFG